MARQVTRHLQGLLWTQAVLALRPLRPVQFPPQRRLTQGFLPSLALNASCRRFRRTVMHWMRVGRIGILGALEMSTPPFRHARPIPLKHECSPVPRATRTPQTCGRCASFNGPSLSRPCQTLLVRFASNESLNAPGAVGWYGKAAACGIPSGARAQHAPGLSYDPCSG